METEKQRTLKQNKSLHKFCELLADELNAAGLDMKTVLKPSVDIPWSKTSVKEFLCHATEGKHNRIKQCGTE